MDNGWYKIMKLTKKNTKYGASKFCLVPFAVEICEKTLGLHHKTPCFIVSVGAMLFMSRKFNFLYTFTLFYDK